MIYDEIGNNIKRLRHENNMTQSRLAEILSVSHQMISKYENGAVVPDIGMLVKICDIFKVSLDVVCGIDESSKESLIRRLSEKYSDKLYGSYDIHEKRYHSFLSEASTVMSDDRIMHLQLSLLEGMHDNIENDQQHRAVNEMIFECAEHILDTSHNDSLRSFANYRMAVYYYETPFSSPDFQKNLKLSKEYSNKILISTYFPEYIIPIGRDIRDGEYTGALKSNISFFAEKLYRMIDVMKKRGELTEYMERYGRLSDLLGEIIDR